MMVGDRKGPPGSIWRLPGYGGFFLAATLGRVADEMLAIAVVLLVLDRTSSPALAGATVAAASLPSVLTNPVLLAAALLGMLLAAGRAPAWVVSALAVVGGIGAPMLTGGITSMIPLLVPPGPPSRWRRASRSSAWPPSPVCARSTRPTPPGRRLPPAPRGPRSGRAAPPTGPGQPVPPHQPEPRWGRRCGRGLRTWHARRCCGG